MATRKSAKTAKAAEKAPVKKKAQGGVANRATEKAAKPAARPRKAAKAAVKKSSAKKAPAKQATKGVGKQAVAKKAVVKKAAKKAAAGKPAAKKVALRKETAKAGKASAKPVPAKSAAKSVPAKRVSKAAPRKVTPRQALANTRKLLEQKQAHDRETQPWQLLDPHHTPVADPGFQSNEAADKAVELHAAESRMKAIQGSLGTQDRHNQGKRDNR